MNALRVRTKTPPPQKGPPPELLAVMDETDGAASEATLQTIREKVKEVRELDLRIITAEERLSEYRSQRSAILTKTLPDMMTAAQVPSIGVAAEGNLPAVEVAVKKFYSANIAADWEDEKREAGFRLLEQHGAGDLVKMVLTVEFAMGTAKMQKTVMAALRKLRVAFAVRKMVPHSSLTAWIRERYNRGEPLSTQDLDSLGATVGNVAQIKVVKPKK